MEIFKSQLKKKLYALAFELGEPWVLELFVLILIAAFVAVYSVHGGFNVFVILQFFYFLIVKLLGLLLSNVLLK